jgi:hypothetical protein
VKKSVVAVATTKPRDHREGRKPQPVQGFRGLRRRQGGTGQPSRP